MGRQLQRAEGARGSQWSARCRLCLVLALVLLCAPLALISGSSSAGASSGASSSASNGAAGPAPQTISTSHAATGCGKAPPVSPGTSQQELLRVGGLLRSYLLYVPRGYRATVPTPLMLSFHGHHSTARIQQRITGFSLLANQDGFLVVYPQGTVGPDGLTGWATGLRRYPGVNDVAFVSDLLTHLQETLCVDPHRIYASGFSNGGGMVALLACRLARRIAAFATVSGSYFPLAGGCNPGRAVPLLEIHGTADRIVPYAGSRRRNLPSIPDWLAQWAARDGCAPTQEVFVRSATVIGEQWNACRPGGALVHYQLIGGRHVWPVTVSLPGRGPVSTAALVWAFCQAHPLA